MTYFSHLKRDLFLLMSDQSQHAKGFKFHVIGISIVIFFYLLSKSSFSVSFKLSPGRRQVQKYKLNVSVVSTTKRPILTSASTTTTRIFTTTKQTSQHNITVATPGHRYAKYVAYYRL